MERNRYSVIGHYATTIIAQTNGQQTNSEIRTFAMAEAI
jgi:hypothetical protein